MARPRATPADATETETETAAPDSLEARFAALVEEMAELRRRTTAPAAPAPAAGPDVTTLAQAIATATEKARAAAAPDRVGGRVGIRNISSTVIGITTPEGEVTLFRPLRGVAEPRVAAEIPYTFWQTFRKGLMVGQGLLVRDDSVLAPDASRAPEDRPQDLHPDHARHAVEDPHAWIEARDEGEIEAAVEAMTSEPTLQRLLESVTERLVEIAHTRFADHPEQGRKAARALPSKYRKVEELCLDRFDEMRRAAGDTRADEVKSTIRF